MMEIERIVIFVKREERTMSINRVEREAGGRMIEQIKPQNIKMLD